jgi:NAD(P)-dependent dehydrogenase (short-subunit alcohol dehydrogenase family)
VAGLTGKVALVTGGASGLGAATARELVERGAQVVVADIDVAGAERVAREIGGVAQELDASDLESNRAAVEAVRAAHGRLDLVHLNAGVVSGCGVEDDFDLALYRRAMGVNLDGVVFGTHAALPLLRASGGGSIVATASLAGLLGVPFDPIYTANKHAVVGFARSMGETLANDGIRFNAICPGFAESAMTAPLREMIDQGGFTMIPAEQVGRVVADVFEGEGTAQAWVIQSGREAIAYEFRRVPGPRPVG